MKTFDLLHTPYIGVLNKRTIKQLQDMVWSYHLEHGRHELPWRKTRNPFRILVSEVMLQQTQVGRVIPKYIAFVRRFPNVHKLAEAPLAEVLLYWQGLGYNRRAKALQELAQVVVRDYAGRMPWTYEELLALPGVGPYTASAVCAFAYEQPVTMIETNIRTVLFHHVVKGEDKVSDAELLVLAEKILDTERPREWHYALMDYGSYLKCMGVRSNHQSKHYVKQKPFKGSDREVRGAIIRTLVQQTSADEREIICLTKIDPDKIREQLSQLKKEGMIMKKDTVWFLP